MDINRGCLSLNETVPFGSQPRACFCSKKKPLGYLMLALSYFVNEGSIPELIWAPDEGSANLIFYNGQHESQLHKYKIRRLDRRDSSLKPK